MHNVWIIASLALLLNLPFGFWRAGVKTFSPSWFLAVHLPVPLVVGLRLESGIGWQLASFPIMIGAFFLGQFLGGKFPRPGKRIVNPNGF